MHIQLKRFYFKLLAPVIIGFAGACAYLRFQGAGGLTEPASAVIAPAMFILAAGFGIAGPILYRSIFAYRRRNHARVPGTEFYKFERNLTGIALTAPYLALAGYLMQLPRFHMATVILAALYAIYTSYPLEKRIRLDEKIFRIDPCN